ncbi:putative membrane protein [Sphingomonas faeni]|uniref:Putative membrane protein n=2 Tax=Sphingomonas faeni TaxID=185950 RepID=A0A2T5UB31_9SPHN|nr:putative membrane protein [Sphingomonas faeni]
MPLGFRAAHPVPSPWDIQGGTNGTNTGKTKNPSATDRCRRLRETPRLRRNPPLAAVLTALIRGRPHWPEVPTIVWFHLATILVALAFTPIMLLRKRGDRPHRALGTIWVVAMLATALASFGIRTSTGGFGIIHLLSIFTLVQVPIIWWSARAHNLARHRTSVRGMVAGALLIAGVFTFPFGRMLGTWLFA